MNAVEKRAAAFSRVGLFDKGYYAIHTAANKELALASERREFLSYKRNDCEILTHLFSLQFSSTNPSTTKLALGVGSPSAKTRTTLPHMHPQSS